MDELNYALCCLPSAHCCRQSMRGWSLATIHQPLATIFCLLLLAGCGRASGPARYEISGKVTYAGQPVPTGSILFVPDKSKGNDGPGVSADIQEGFFRTRPKDGTIGGPHIANIHGFDGKSYKVGPLNNPLGRPFFSNIQIAVDLPKQASTHDFVIPAQKGK